MSMNDEPRMLIRLTSFGYKWTRNKYEINSVCGRSIECTFSPIVSDPYLILCYQ